MNFVALLGFRRMVAIAALGLLLSVSGLPATARQANKETASGKTKSQLDGAWRLVRAKDATGGQYRDVPPGVEMTKLIVDGRYAWVVTQNGIAVAGAGGNYSVSGHTYTENVTYGVTTRQQPMVGRSFAFTWTIEGGKWHHKGTLRTGSGVQEIDEIWERIP
jgi:hypothetical protein